MAFTIQLEDEQGNKRGVAWDRTDVLGQLAQRDRASVAGFRLLRYLDPYGDTVFNALQAGDLILDIRQLATATSDKDSLRFLDDLCGLVERTHEGLLLRFSGD